jgi:outer membrane protein assembly factor BamB
VAFAASDGHQLWSVSASSLGDGFGLPFYFPSIANHVVYDVLSNGSQAQLLAFNETTGHLLFTGPNNAEPSGLVISHGSVYVGSLSGGICQYGL